MPLSYIISKPKMPLSLIFYATSKCNLRCNHCFLSGRLGQGTDLTLDEIEKIFNNIHNIKRLSITGGEPFLRSDLLQIIEIILSEHEIRYFTITTNGILTKEIIETAKNIPKKYKKTLFEIVVSLDGFEKTHNEIRNTNSYKKSVRTIKELKRIGKPHKNLFIGINTVISNKNYKELPAFYDYVYENIRPDFHYCDILRGTPKNSSIRVPPVSELEKILKQLIDKQLRYNKGLPFTYRLMNAIKQLHSQQSLSIIKKSKRDKDCYAGILIGVINSNGDVQLCELLKTVGNLRDYNYDFGKVWSSPVSDNQRNFIKKGGCLCTHTCFQTLNILRNYKLYPKILLYSFKGLK